MTQEKLDIVNAPWDGFLPFVSTKRVECAIIRAAEFEADGSGRVAIESPGGIMVGNALTGSEIVNVPADFQRTPGALSLALDGDKDGTAPVGAVLIRYVDGYLSWIPGDKFVSGEYTLDK